MLAARGVSGLPLTVKDGQEGFLTLYTPSEAQAELVRRFGPLISRFVRVLLTGRYREGDRHVLTFLSYFSRASTPPAQTAMMLKKRLRHYHKHHDLFREGVLAFLEAIHKGDNISGAFPSYFSNRVDLMIKDPIHSPKCQLDSESEWFLLSQYEPDPQNRILGQVDMDSFMEGLTGVEREWVNAVLSEEDAGAPPESIKEWAQMWLL